MQAAALGVSSLGDQRFERLSWGNHFANLGPLALLSLVGGSLADTGNRRKILSNADLATYLDDSLGSQCR